MKTVATVMGGLATLVGSFWLTLKIIDGPQLGPPDFDLAVAADGFALSSDAVVGAVDVIQRDPTGRLQLEGWAFDKELAQPVTVLLLVGPKFQRVAVTSGPRPDVTAILNHSPEQTRNVAFAGLTGQPVDCGPHTIVAVNQKKHLSILASEVMLPRCTTRGL
ncbi:MAG TPA: hypothetical protein VKQ32_03785 [Polyangia bacterium]|nr:hypothetical protein [Polyangia bacterium]